MLEPDTSFQPESFRRNERLSMLVNHILVALMMGCFGFTLAELTNRVVPDWHLGYVPSLAILVCLEAMYTWRTTRRWTTMEVDGMGYWTLEWVVLMVMVKLYLYLWLGVGQLVADLPAYRAHFLETFFNPNTIYAFVIAGIFWMAGAFFSRFLTDLEGDDILINAELMGGITSDRGAVRSGLASVIWGIGALVVILTSLVYFQLDQFGQPQAVPRGSLLNVVIYFILAFGLLSQTQFSVLRASWAWEQIPISRDLLRRWAIASLIFLAIIGFVAFLLPTRFSLGFLSTMNAVFQLIASLVMILVFLILSPFLYLFGLIAGLLGKAAPTNTRPAEVIPQIIDRAAEGGTGLPIPWLELAKSILFWVIFLGVIVFAFVQYLRQNRELVARLRDVPFLAWLANLLEWLGSTLQLWNKQVRQAVRSGIERIRPKPRAGRELNPFRFTSLRRLSPRQRVFFFYLALIRRSGETGLPRQPWQTPYEYAQSLKPNLEESTPDLEAMTDTFLEARYSQHEISPDQVGIVHRAWEHLRKALQRLRKKDN